VIIVDSHCHAAPLWYEPVETLLYQMDSHGVGQAVLIQMLGQYHNDYQQDCLRRYPGRFASVVAVDASRTDACEQLTRLAAQGACGVRLRPEARSPGNDPLAIWRTAEYENLAVSCVGTGETFAAPEFSEVLETLSGLPIVLEHLGAGNHPDADAGQSASRQRVFELAKFPNVYLKVPGLGELAQRAAVLPAETVPLDKKPAILETALARFGPERLMWGSDFPPVAAREGYGNALRWVRDALGDLSADAQEQIFCGTARQIFRLPST